LLGSVAVFIVFRSLSGADPGAALALVSALATVAGISWVLSPLVTGVALSESHDVSRLLHFPIPVPVLAAASLAANLAQPMVLAEIPILLALSLAIADHPGLLLLTAPGVALSFAFVLACAQVASLVLQGVSRNRRFHDAALFAGIGLGVALSLGPLLLLAGGARPMRAVLAAVLRSDVFAFSPFAWGVRAAIHGGRGEAGPFLAYAVLATAALLAAVAVSVVLIHRIHRGELNLGGAASGRASRARMVLPGAMGALVEKDVRSAWRDPAMKASLFLGLLMPLLFALFLTATGGRDATVAFGLAVFVGLSGFGANTFGFERRGIGLLLSFPLERWKLLLGKNLGAAVFRLPGLLAVALASIFLAPPTHLPAVLTMALVTLTLAAGLDNYASVLFPAPVPPPGGSPYGGSTSRRGLAGAVLVASLMMGSLLVASPFLILAWLPPKLGPLSLWLLTLPLALAGAGAVYAMLVAGAAGLLERRETLLLERVLEEA